jgi:hypothetical protein
LTKKGLQLDKADFVINGYEVDEDKYIQNPNKAMSLSGKGMMKVDEVMADVPSTEDIEEENVVALDDDDAILTRRKNASFATGKRTIDVLND